MNSNKHAFLLVTLLLLAATATKAQTFEVPNIEYANNLCELRSENRVFVYAPLNTRQELVEELRKHSDLVVVERPEESDFFLIFGYALEGATGALDGGSSETARAEMTALKFVRDRQGGTRPRILFYWSGQKSVHNLPMPLSSVSPGGFRAPNSGKNALGELITRLGFWAASKKWPSHFQFDQFTNQLTINLSGKLERKGAKGFLKELKNARSDSYAATCAIQPLALSKPDRQPPRTNSAPMFTPEPLFAPGLRPSAPINSPELPGLTVESTTARRPKRVTLPRRHRPKSLSARGLRHPSSRSRKSRRPSYTRTKARTMLQR